MKTDRELLELAAKAAGIALEWCPEGRAWRKWPSFEWNPLTDDGDALRLANTLEIDIGFHINVEAIAYGRRQNGEQCHTTKEVGLSMAATRRAIVRAAAELGSQS